MSKNWLLWAGLATCTLHCASLRAQTKDNIMGKVVSEKQQPLEGAQVVVKDAKGTTSNLDGSFQLQANIGDSIFISHIGFKTLAAVISQNEATYMLSSQENSLNEVVVTALGIRREKNALGYATTTVNGDQFTQSRDANIGNALTGKVAGLSVANNATGPMGSSRVVIRGAASISGNNQPLYVIDGIPYDNTSKGGSGQYGGIDYGDGLTNIDPDDIQNLQVLKGVAASALYGYRGGNGAILITTKSKGAKGVKAELNNNLTFNKVIDFRDFQYEYGQGDRGTMPADQTASLATYRSSWGAKFSGQDFTNFLGNTVKYQPYSQDNFKNFYRTGLFNQTSVAVYGGNEKGNIRLGFSNLKYNDIVPNSDAKIQTINLNTFYEILPRFTVHLTANYVFDNVYNRSSTSDPNQSTTGSVFFTSNTFDIRWLSPQINADGTELLPSTNIFASNPYFTAYRHKNATNRNRLTGGLTLKYDVTDWLYIQGQITRDGYSLDIERIYPTGTGIAQGGKLTQLHNTFYELNKNAMIGLKSNSARDFQIKGILGVNSQEDENVTTGIQEAGPFVIPYLYSSNNILEKPFYNDYSKYKVNSIFSSVELSYKNFLYLNGTAREDWFSTLSVDNNHYLYPSASMSFVYSNLFKLPSWFDFGKIRASYARGSNGTSPYQNQLYYGLKNTTVFNNGIGTIYNVVVPNNGLKPVKIEEMEVGLENRFLKGRLNFEMSFYQKKTSDDIVNITASSASGYTGTIMNIGKIRNRGIELLIGGSPISTADFIWNTSFNFGRNWSKVLDLGEGVNSINVDGALSRSGNASIQNIVGLPYGQIVGYGIQRDADGNKIIGANGELLRTTSVVNLGTGVYNFVGGFSNGFTYKNFSLSSLFDFKYGAKMFSGTNLSLYNSGLQKETVEGRDGGLIAKGVLADGTVNTTSVDAQTYWQNLSGGNNNIDELFVYDASFIKLRQLSLAYQFNPSFFRNKSIKGLTISLVGRNLAILMKHTPNIDPESGYTNGNGQGLELNGYPLTRNYGININIKF